MNPTDLSDAERDEFRDMIRAGAERITRRRRARGQLIAVASAVVLVGAIAAGAIASATGLGSRVPIATTPTATPTASASPTSVVEPSTPTPTPTPTSTPTSTPDPTPPVASDPEPLTFTFECLLALEGEEGYTGEMVPFATMAEVWEIPTVRFCEAFAHGEVWTDTQREAILLAEAAHPVSDDLETLTSLYVQCAMTVNGYADIPSLTMHQDDEVRGFLALCPDRPDADRMRAALPENQ